MPREGGPRPRCFLHLPHRHALPELGYGTVVNDFVVANGTPNGAVYHHARVILCSGSPGCRFETRSTRVDVAVGATASSSFFSSTNILRLFECSLSAGQTYAAVVDSVSGAVDYGIRAYRGTRCSGRRGDNDGWVNSHGCGGDESLVFTASESSTYGFVVGNENGGSGAFTFRIWQKPVVAAISNATVPAATLHAGPTPSLSPGTTPVLQG